MEDRRQLDPGISDALSHFLDVVKVTHCMYKDSERILGKTIGMCILQDFEILTPNLLAQTIETLEGGGLVTLILDQFEAINVVLAAQINIDLNRTIRSS